MKVITRLSLLTGALLSVLWLLSTVVSADQAYHTERLEFQPVGGANELRAGQVINAHSNGPIRYARETYMVNGAAANATYDVIIQVFFGGDCTGTPDVALTTAVIETGAKGQGHASHVFVPADVAPFNPPLTIHARWVLERNGTVDYQTRCTVINLD
jgi:hypothetical protein